MGNFSLDNVPTTKEEIKNAKDQLHREIKELNTKIEVRRTYLRMLYSLCGQHEYGNSYVCKWCGHDCE